MPPPKAPPKSHWRGLAGAPIYVKVSLAPGLILAALVLLSLLSLRILDTAGTRLQAISEQAFPTYQRAAETKDAVNAIQTALQHMLSVAANESDAVRILKVAAPVREAMARATAALDRLRRQVGAGTEQTGMFGKSFEEYQSAVSDVLRAATSDPATATMLMADADEQFAKLSGELDGIKNRADAASQSMTREAIAAAAGERLLLLSGLVLAIVICAGIIAVTSRAIGRPIKSLTGRMVAMADDDLDRDIPALHRGDEIGAMARAVDVFRRNGLHARQHAAESEREQAAKQIHQAAMSQHTNDFGLSISGVMTSLGGSAEAVRRSAAAMTEAATRVFDHASSTAETAATSSLELASVASAIEQLTASVDEISRQVATAATIARDAVRSASAGQGTMREMAQAARRIGDVVRLISEIAGQTNLLALNATIEAARAGESGRGFAVVAGEVKTLATRTSKATSDIDAQIAAVTGASDAALAAMVEVATIIGKMDDVASAIAAAVEQQAVTTRELAASVQTLSGSSDQTALAMREVAGVAGNAGGVSRQVLRAADTIGCEAEKLRSEVTDFLLAVRDDIQERRRYERIPGRGTVASLRLPGREPISAVLKDLSRGGASLQCDLTLAVGDEVGVELPDAGGAITARAVRSGGGLLAVVFHQDAADPARVDRALDALTIASKAA
jgi:methyl-accepting chemotaxis protein